MPYFEKNGKELQILVSEYSLYTILKSVIDLHYLKYNTTVTSDAIQSIISDFEKPFGDQKQLELFSDVRQVMVKMLTAKSENFMPNVKISNDETTFAFEVEIHIMNPFDNSVDAIVMKCVITTKLVFHIGTTSEKYSLFAEADDLEMEFTEIDAYFKTRLTKDSLNDRISFIKPFAVGYINKMLNDGIGIPIPPNLQKLIKNPQIKALNHFLKIDFEPSKGSPVVMAQHPTPVSSFEETQEAFG